jgi:hypothetical protein
LIFPFSSATHNLRPRSASAKGFPLDGKPLLLISGEMHLPVFPGILARQAEDGKAWD